MMRNYLFEQHYSRFEMIGFCVVATMIMRADETTSAAAIAFIGGVIVVVLNEVLRGRT